MHLLVLSGHRWATCARCCAAGLLSVLGLLTSEDGGFLPLLRLVPLADLQELAADAIAAGFPDAATGELRRGELRITSTTHPEGKRERRYPGLHIALADGTILRNLQVPVLATENLQVDRSKLQPLKAGTLEELLAHLDPKLHDGAARSFDRHIARAGLTRSEIQALAPYAPLLALTADHIEPPILMDYTSFAACLHLARRGLPDAGRLLVSHAITILDETRNTFHWPPQAILTLSDGLLNYTGADYAALPARDLLLSLQLGKESLPLARRWAIRVLMKRLAHPTHYERPADWVSANSWHSMPRDTAKRLLSAWTAKDEAGCNRKTSCRLRRRPPPADRICKNVASTRSDSPGRPMATARDFR